MKKAIQKAIDPEDHFDVPLWCVYGPSAFLASLCCKVVPHASSGPIIWGYSTYKNQPAFRTLGITLADFYSKREKPYFFRHKEDALNYISAMLEPKTK